MNNRTQWWIRPQSKLRTQIPLLITLTPQAIARRESPGRTRSRLKHDYLCISVIIRSSQLPPLATRTRIRDNIAPVLWAEREREEARENWEWQKLETERLIKAEYVSHGREHYWCDFRLLSSQFPPQFRNVMSWLCWSVFVFVVIVWPPSALLYWLWRLGTGPRPAPLAAHCSQFSSFQQTRLTRLFLWE